MLLNVGLYKNHHCGTSINIKRWEIVEKRIDGFKLHKQFGKKRQNIFTIGHAMLSSNAVDTIRNQTKNNIKPPSILCTILNEARYYILVP